MTKEDALFFLERFRTTGINEHLYEALGVAIKALSIQAGKDAQPQWIPVTERLPERNGRYLVARGNDAGAFWNRVYIVNYSDLMGLNKEKHWWTGDVGKSNFERILDVLAWMPLPEPYKGGQG